jgi:hypothetical protein
MKIPFRTINYSIDPSIVGVKGGMGSSYLSDDFFNKNVGYNSIFSKENLCGGIHGVNGNYLGLICMRLIWKKEEN